MKTWIVVADACRARVFERNSTTPPLTELQSFVHVQSRQSRAASIDEYGRVFENGKQPRHYIEPKVSPQEQEAQIFAHELGSFLDSAQADRRFDNLVLVAPPAFLGTLREQIDARTQKHIAGTLNKNLTLLDPGQIASYVKYLH